MASELLPCPFCGSAPTVDDLRPGDVGIGCSNNGCPAQPSAYDFNLANATAAWNRRAPNAAARDAALEEAAALCDDRYPTRPEIAAAIRALKGRA